MATLAVLAIGVASMPTRVTAQVGQTAMQPAAGLINGAAARLAGPGGGAPGFLYYGLNAADRGLGYRGSYMTLGGFIPVAEDDLGGFWSADLRGHLSVYGGFFSNVGAVRKQFIGGTLLGVGVYWDYDGDMNQYPDAPIPVGLGNIYSFAGGQAYNQVGVSGEWLTDWGNLRSNGYIPVGSTAQLVGPFLGNVVLCQNGINAALGGADLEVGAYVPGLTDWAGMISVGGYALGNTQDSFPGGTEVVPWFGGVYTRLDMTFRQGWDFSLQANNDSFFDWTGFARLTYRMGGSRRRNVPDQVEQPMMRNEHIVRVHQTPEVAFNPANGLPWLVFHVDNTAAPGGTGSAEAPFNTLTAANARPVNSPYDILYLRTGNSAVAPYVTPVGGYTFGAPNQYFVGEGTTLTIPTLGCGNLSLQATNATTVYPVITNPLGPALVVNQPGTIVDHVQISNSTVGISDGAGFAAPGEAFISDVIISGNGGPFQRGVQIDNSTGAFNFTNVRLRDLTNDGFVVNAAGGDVRITDSSLTNVAQTGVLVTGAGARVALTNSTISGSTTVTGVQATGNASAVTIAGSGISGVINDAVVASGPAATVTITTSTIADTGRSALVASGAGATITGSAARIVRTGTGTAAPAIVLSGVASQVTLRASSVTDVTGVGVLLTGAGSRFRMSQATELRRITQDGIQLNDPTNTAFALIDGRAIVGQTGGHGVNTNGSSVQLSDATIELATLNGIFATGVNGAANCVWVQGSTIRNTDGEGIVAIDSNLRVERLDPADGNSRVSTITNTGAFGIRATANNALPVDMAVLVDSTTISGVATGIAVAANDDGIPATTPTINFTATNNNIRTTNAGTGISVSGVFDTAPGFPGAALSRVNSAINGNTIFPGLLGRGILLNTVGGPAQFPTPGGPIQAPPANRPLTVQAAGAADLSGLNNAAVVAENPAPAAGIFSSINWDPAVLVPLPPVAPLVPPLP